MLTPIDITLFILPFVLFYEILKLNSKTLRTQKFEIDFKTIHSALLITRA